MNARAVAMVLVLGLAATAPAAAQLRLSADGGLFNAQRRVLFPSGFREQTGMLLSGGAAANLGRLRLGLGGVMGTLKGDGTDANRDVAMRSSALTLHVQALPGVLVGGRFEVRRFDADGDVTMWKLMGASVRLEPGLGIEGLRAGAEVAILPSSSVSLGPKLSVARQATIGASYAPAGRPFVFRLAYRFERYDIAASGQTSERYEQFRGVVVEAGLRLGR